MQEEKQGEQHQQNVDTNQQQSQQEQQAPANETSQTDVNATNEGQSTSQSTLTPFEEKVHQGLNEGDKAPEPVSSVGPSNVSNPNVTNTNETKIPEKKEEAPTRTITPGRTIVFYPGADDSVARADGNETVPALVVKVLDNNQVNIRVFPSGDAVPVYKNVPHKDNANTDDVNSQYWDWPEIK